MDDKEVIHGYEIQRAIVFENNRGFALAENPNAVTPFVTWQFTEDDNGARDYYWGHYAANKDSAVRDFETRVSEYQKDYGVSERTAHSTPPKRIAEQLAEAEKQVARGIDAPAKKQNKSHEDR